MSMQFGLTLDALRRASAKDPNLPDESQVVLDYVDGPCLLTDMTCPCRQALFY